jgi:hypothetical protein
VIPNEVPVEEVRNYHTSREAVAGPPSLAAALLFYISVRAQEEGHPPQEWVTGAVAKLDKIGGKAGPLGKRLINLLDPWGKMLTTAPLRRWEDVPENFQNGFAKKRSTREAIGQAVAVAERTAGAGLSTADELIDIFRAFDQLSQTGVLEDVQEQVDAGNMPSWFASMIHRIFEAGEIELSSDEHYDLKHYFHVGLGVRQGDPLGPRLFRRRYDRLMKLWSEKLIEEDLESMKNLCYNYKGRNYDVSLVVFADDAKRMFATLLGATLRSEVQTGMATLDTILATDNLKRN